MTPHERLGVALVGALAGMFVMVAYVHYVLAPAQASAAPSIPATTPYRAPPIDLSDVYGGRLPMDPRSSPQWERR